MVNPFTLDCYNTPKLVNIYRDTIRFFGLEARLFFSIEKHNEVVLPMLERGGVGLNFNYWIVKYVVFTIVPFIEDIYYSLIPASPNNYKIQIGGEE